MDQKPVGQYILVDQINLKRKTREWSGEWSGEWSRRPHDSEPVGNEHFCRPLPCAGTTVGELHHSGGTGSQMHVGAAPLEA